MAPVDIAKRLGEIRQDAVDAVAELKRTLDGRLTAVEAALLRAPDAGGYSPRHTKSLGARLVESDEYKSFLNRQCKGRVYFPINDGLWDSKTAITQVALGWSTPGILAPQRGVGIVPGARRQLRIRDLIPAFPTDAPAVEYVKENVFTNAASPQAEGESKAESALTFTICSERVRTLAHWCPISRQAAQDVTGLMDYVSTTLLYGLKLVEEREILNGDNLGDHLNGIVTQATAYDTGLNVANDTKLDKLRHAIYQCEVTERGPCDGIVLHPKDAHDIDLIKTDEGGVSNAGTYVVGDPLDPNSSMTVKTLWGKPVVESFSMAQGRFLVGGFKTGSQLRDSMQALIEVSAEHSDYFTRNLLAVRCEERACVLVTVPALFVYGSF